MADIKPFGGFFFSRERVGDLSDVVAPPYDVISAEKRDELRRRHANNIVRLTLGDPRTLSAAERADEGRYLAAAETLRRWREEGVLEGDSKPCLYAMEEEFSWRGRDRKRRGLFAAVRLEDFGGPNILRHERTLSAPIEDRAKLLEATRCQLEPVFMISDDPDGGILSILADSLASKPATEFRSAENGTRHRLVRIDDSRTMEAITSMLRPQPFLIADGHHRYTTSLNYARNEGKAVESAQWLLAFIVPASDPAVVLSATHRAVPSDLPEEGFLELARGDFTIEEGMLSWTDFRKTNAPLALLSPETARMFALHPRDSALASVPSDLRGVSSALFNHLVLKRHLGMDPENPLDQTRIRYHSDAEAFSLGMPRGELGFWLRPLAVAEVLRIARAGWVLPQKSTYFYPKVVSGALIRPLD